MYALPAVNVALAPITLSHKQTRRNRDGHHTVIHGQVCL